MIVDLFLVYQFIRRLVTPFKEWEAYKLGIIDADGNILKKRRDLRTAKEIRAFGTFDLMILKLKKLLATVPGGANKIATYAAALWLIREWNHFTEESLITEDLSEEQIDESIKIFHEKYLNKIKEEPANSAGSGAIAGLGVGAQGEPGLTPDQQKKYKRKNKKDIQEKIDLLTMLKNSNYQLARDSLLAVLSKEGRKKDVLYYAQRVSKSYPGVDPKKLANMV